VGVRMRTSSSVEMPPQPVAGAMVTATYFAPLPIGMFQMLSEENGWATGSRVVGTAHGPPSIPPLDPVDPVDPVPVAPVDAVDDAPPVVEAVAAPPVPPFDPPALLEDDPEPVAPPLAEEPRAAGFEAQPRSNATNATQPQCAIRPA
jgi:hypothetical protein